MTERLDPAKMEARLESLTYGGSVSDLVKVFGATYPNMKVDSSTGMAHLPEGEAEGWTIGVKLSGGVRFGEVQEFWPDQGKIKFAYPLRGGKATMILDSTQKIRWEKR